MSSSALDDIEALWSVEGRTAALAASVVALADALGLEEATVLDNTLSAPTFDFSAIILAQSDTGSALPALLAEAGFAGHPALSDPSLDDTALMIVCQDSLTALSALLGESVDALLTLTEVHQLEVQGLWLAQNLSAALQGQMMLMATRDALPAQVPASLKATAGLAQELSLTVPDLPWTADRWPISDQVSSLQSLSGLLQGFDVEAGVVLEAAKMCAESRFTADALGRLHREMGQALDDLNRALDQWSPPSQAQQLASPGEVALVQGALARARDVLEQATGEPE